MPVKASEWSVVDGTLRLTPHGSDAFVPTAAEVTGAEFKDRLTIRGHDVSQRPGDALTDIEFSRFAPDVRIVVTPPAADLSVSAECRIELVLDGKIVRTIEGAASEEEHAVSSGNWFPMPSESLLEAYQLLRKHEITRCGKLSLRQYVALRTDNSNQIGYDAPPAKILTKTGETPFESSVRAELYGYQKDGVAWLRRVAGESLGCILGDEMGLGKTLQIIALIATETAAVRKPTLIIAPATLIANWQRELARFAPQLTITDHRGASRTGFPSEIRRTDIVLTTYDIAVRDLSLMCMIDWNLLVIDEAQAIKTPGAMRTRCIKQIPRRCSVAVSGTPVENRLTDLWSLMDFAVPGLLGSRTEFESEYRNTASDASRLEPVVTPFLLRRRVRDVASDLPVRIDIPQPVELSDEQADRYEAIRSEIAAKHGAAASLISIIRLRQFCAHPFLLEPNTGDPVEGSTKYQRLTEILEEIRSLGEKTIIFTSFHEMADMLKRDLTKRLGTQAEIIDGRTPVEDRQKLVDAFGGAGPGAMLILNPKAAGTGLNITSANHVIHYNLDWNPAVEDQATARAHRRGQTRPVTVHRLYHPGTIEEVIDGRLRSKRDIANEAVLGIDGSGDDLADILRAIEISPLKAGGQV